MPAQIQRDSHNRPPTQFLPHWAGQTRQILQAASVFSVPAEAIPGALQVVPAYAGIGMVEQKTITPSHGQVFRVIVENRPRRGVSKRICAPTRNREKQGSPLRS